MHTHNNFYRWTLKLTHLKNCGEQEYNFPTVQRTVDAGVISEEIAIQC